MTTGLETAQYTCLSEQSLLIPDGIDFFHYAHYSSSSLTNKAILFGTVRYPITERPPSKIDSQRYTDIHSPQ